MAEITAQTLAGWGFRPGHWLRGAVATAKAMQAGGASEADIRAAVERMQPSQRKPQTEAAPFAVLLDPENELERQNLEAVVRHMEVLMRVPTIRAGAVMPDACPSGMEQGTIPVGGAVAAEDAIHPGFHSADICCSVALTAFARDDDPRRILDAMHAATHFGPGGRPKPIEPPADLMRHISGNAFLAGLEGMARHHFGTQGDGNHFAYVGHLRSTGRPVLVTHHGSRGLGAELYKRGTAAAQRHTAAVAGEVPKHNAWIKASSAEGRAYWEALQIIRDWTRANHYTLHDRVAQALGNRVETRFWNEHNFVFRRSDGLYYHGKGATPSWSGFAADDAGLTLIPLNMAEPILIARHTDRPEALGFAPHGAGRNMGRKAFLRGAAGAAEQELAELKARGLDVRAFCGAPDLSELPGAYKNAAAVRAQIEKYRLAEIVDEVEPYGSIMAGDVRRNAPWRTKRRALERTEAATR